MHAGHGRQAALGDALAALLESQGYAVTLEFYYNDVVNDPEVTPLMSASPATYADGVLKVVDDYTFTMTFSTAFPESVLYNFAYGNFCPGPAHILKPHHPKYGGKDYTEFHDAFPADYMNFPVMGGWVVVEHRPDDIVVLRRNPYYWKVDEAGNQLPYLNEMHYRLSTWADRDVQTVAGTADLSNLEQPENYVEALKGAAPDTAPARLEFAARLLGYGLATEMAAPAGVDARRRYFRATAQGRRVAAAQLSMYSTVLQHVPALRDAKANA